MSAEPPRSAGEPAPSTEPSGRALRPATIAIAAAALLLPLLAVLVLYRGGRTIVGTRTAPAPAAAPADEEIEPPSIRESAEPGSLAFAGMKEPRDAALDGRGRLWVADFGNSRLKVFDAKGSYLGGWGGRGNGQFAFRDLSALAIGGKDVYVADTWNGRVQKFSLSGEWKASAVGLFGPRGIAIARDGRVWVSDTGNHRVLAYGADFGTPEFFGTKGSGPGEFSSPVGIACAADGTVYVADTGNRRIVLLDSGGAFRKEWPFPGWDRPVEPHLELDTDGSLWATDPGTAEAVLHLDRKGKVVDRRTAGDDGRRFSLPTGLALDAGRRVLYVVNAGNNTVVRLRLPGGKTS